MMKKISLFIFLIIIVIWVSGCSKSQPNVYPAEALSATDVPVLAPASALPKTPETVPTVTTVLSQTVLPQPASTKTPDVVDQAFIATTTLADQSIPTSTTLATPNLGPEDWKALPIIPVISPKVIEIYQRGQTLGNNPSAFSKIGDCGSTPAWFLGDFDRGPRFYRLGEFQNLDAVIQAYQGSYSRTSLAAKSGFNASSIFSPLWSDPKQCQPNETPLACEYRVQRPSIAFIMLGSNDVYHPAEFEPQMRKIIELSIEQGIIPVLSTKADNIEGDGSINATLARLAQEYDIPLWNYWRAVQGLPDQGLQEDKVHITWAPNRFDDPQSMTRGWPVRNLTALQLLDAIWQAVNHE